MNAVLIVTGCQYFGLSCKLTKEARQAEIIDLKSDRKYKCPKIKPFPKDMFYAKGGVFEGKTYVCDSTCYMLNENGTWTNAGNSNFNTSGYSFDSFF